MLASMLCVLATKNLLASIPASGPTITFQANGSVLIRNTHNTPTVITACDGGGSADVAFELGRGNQHWRRVYLRTVHSALQLPMRPGTDYELWSAGSFADYVLTSVCATRSSRLMEAQRLRLLAIALANLRSSKITDESAYRIRLASEAYQAILGIGFQCTMRYKATNPDADYRVFAGRSFEAVCSITNGGSERIGPCTLRVLAPDEWAVRTPGTPIPGIAPGRSTRQMFSVMAPAASMLRPKQYPLIAELTFRHQGRKITVHYPVTVEMSNPFTASLRILSADPEHINAEISTRSLFPGTAMSNVSAYPFIPESIRVDPAKQSFSFKENGRFHLTYAKDAEPSPVLRAVTMRMRANEHTVDLRTVMEAYLPVGNRTYGDALWMNDCEGGKTVEAVIGDRRCRQTVSGSHMYFTASPNVPTSGNTYVTVTYFDGPRGSFHVQYDSSTGAYKDSLRTVQFAGTNTWRQATFVLPDINFANRQAAASDFRVTASGADLAVADVIVSKFPPGDTRNH
jgi:hypothetical protein